MFEEYIDNNKNKIIDSVCDLISIPSISVETKKARYPFGKECNEALKYFLELASSLGFRTKDVDGYCGYAEFGEGDELIGIIGHLDVVPAKEDDWQYSPFTPTIENNCIYGRGAIDDKGPVIASLYAMKAVYDYYNENNIKFNKRVRLIVGLNEEKDWKCINYYKEHEESPTIGFSPDADFPCIYAEKGVLSLKISDKNIETPYIQIIDIDYYENAINVVPKLASVTLQIDDGNQMDYIISSVKNIVNKKGYEIDIYKIDNNTLKLTSYGTSSHSSHPELGENAIAKLIIILNDLFSSLKIKMPILSTFCKYIGDDYLGKDLGINIEDESGHLTLTTSQFYLEDSKISIVMNLRIPVNTPIDSIINKFNTTFDNFEIDTLSTIEALYLRKDDKLVTTLCDIFNEECNTDYKPIAIGGATYARAFNNCVSFGMNFPDDEDMCHKADEFINIDKLIIATKIYAKAIDKLLQ